MIYPEHIEEKIDFTSVRELLKQRCISDLGRERVDALHFSTDYEEVSGWLDETDELLRLMCGGCAWWGCTWTRERCTTCAARWRR